MSYLNVISLADAKLELKIDDTQTEDDSIITRAINTALAHIERHTNILVYAREKSYRVTDYCIDVYDSPINSLTTPTDATVVVKALKSTYTLKDQNAVLTLNVGYASPGDVPQDLINVAYEMIDAIYSGREERKATINLSAIGIDIINQNRRFV